MDRHISPAEIISATLRMSQLKDEEKDRLLRHMLEEHTEITIKALKALEALKGSVAATPPPADEDRDFFCDKRRFKVVITEASRKIGLIRRLRHITGLGLPEAKEVVEGKFNIPRSIRGFDFLIWPSMGVMSDSLTLAQAQMLLETCEAATHSGLFDGVKFAVVGQDEEYRFPGFQEP